MTTIDEIVRYDNTNPNQPYPTCFITHIEPSVTDFLRGTTAEEVNLERWEKLILALRFGGYTQIRSAMTDTSQEKTACVLGVGVLEFGNALTVKTNAECCCEADCCFGGDRGCECYEGDCSCPNRGLCLTDVKLPYPSHDFWSLMGWDFYESDEENSWTGPEFLRLTGWRNLSSTYELNDIVSLPVLNDIYGVPFDVIADLMEQTLIGVKGLL